MANDRHVPVLLAETLRFLAPERGGLFVDATVGLGGHTEALLRASPTLRVVGVDRDPRALALAAERLAPWGDRVTLIEGRFGTLKERLGECGISKIDGLLVDLGVSSLQLDDGTRGFAFARDGPLDMRMDQPLAPESDADDLGTTAETIVNRYSEEDLTDILKSYGEEPQARRIARSIVARRSETPLRTTAELRDLIERTKSARPGRRRRVHAATQTFQALRIEVNQELDELRELMRGAAELLAENGRMVAISYHSLEDRIVKNTLRDMATGEIDRITGRPLAETQVIEVLTRKPVRPSEEEVVANPRSRSARLRAGRRL